MSPFLYNGVLTSQVAMKIVWQTLTKCLSNSAFLELVPLHRLLPLSVGGPMTRF